MNDLLDKYPQFKNHKGIKLQSWNICPIGVKSEHDGTRITITNEAAESLAKQIDRTPLMYTKRDFNSAKLPKQHKDIDGKRTVIGTGLGGHVTKDENGLDWLVGDYALYTDVDPEITKRIDKFKDDVSASWELSEQLIDTDGNVYDSVYEGASIMDKDYSAYRHHGLLVADKTGTEGLTSTITYDDILKEVVGKDYQVKLDELTKVADERTTEIETLKVEHDKQLKEKEEIINGLNDENQKVRELNEGFAKLYDN